MSKELNAQEINRMKQSTKEMLDSIGTDTEMGRKVIELIYGFARRGFLEYEAERKFST